MTKWFRLGRPLPFKYFFARAASFKTTSQAFHFLRFILKLQRDNMVRTWAVISD